MNFVCPPVCVRVDQLPFQLDVSILLVQVLFGQSNRACMCLRGLISVILSDTWCSVGPLKMPWAPDRKKTVFVKHYAPAATQSKTSFSFKVKVKVTRSLTLVL